MGHFLDSHTSYFWCPVFLKGEKMKKLVLGLLFLVFFGFVFAEEKYEITEVDIFSLKKQINSESITVRGVSVTNTLQEMIKDAKG